MSSSTSTMNALIAAARSGNYFTVPPTAYNALVQQILGAASSGTGAAEPSYALNNLISPYLAILNPQLQKLLQSGNQ